MCGAGGLAWRVPRRDDRPRQTCVACGYVHYVGPALAAGVILSDRARICLVRRAHDPGFGKWTFPGGFVDVGEAPAAAALRELAEETGLRGEIERFVGIYASLGPQGRPVVILVYAGRLKAGTSAPEGAAPVGGSDEIEEVRWFGPSDLPWEEFAFPSTVTALREFLASPRA
jgi:ADP-ribose pyrophosphatase YjhB (NUDIX family)